MATVHKPENDRIVFWLGLAIAVAMVLGLVLRLATADYPLWRDELASMVFASQPLSRLWSAWMVRETNPPLFYSMLHLWLQAGVQSVVAMRGLPIAGGVAAIGLSAALASRVSGAWAGVAAAFIAAVSAQQIWFSQELRGYIFEADGLLVSMLGLVLWIEGRRARLGLVAYALGTAFAFYCHVTAAIWPVSAGLALVMTRSGWLFEARARRAVEFAIANLALGLLCLWWIWIAAHQLNSDNIDHMQPLSVGAHLSIVWHNTLLIMDSPPHTWAIRMGLTAVIAGAAALLVWRGGAGRVLVVAWLAAVVLFHAAEPIHPIVKTMTVFWLSQFTILLLASAVAAIPNPRARIAGLALVVGLLGYNLADKLSLFWWEDWRKAILTLQRDPQAIMLVEQSQIGMHANWACKVELRTDHCPLPIAVMDSRSTSYAWTREFMDRPLLRRPELDQVLLRYRRVYVVNWGGPDPLVSLGVKPPHACCVGFMRGPFTPQELLSGKYPQQLP